MNEEEVIERLNRYKTIKVLYGNTFAMHLEQLEQLKNDIDTVLNLLEKKDKQIDLMAEQLAGLAIFDIEKDEPLILGDKEEVKQYFKEKVEDRV